jgi:hypothetical protein
VAAVGATTVNLHEARDELHVGVDESEERIWPRRRSLAKSGSPRRLEAPLSRAAGA